MGRKHRNKAMEYTEDTEYGVEQQPYNVEQEALQPIATETNMNDKTDKLDLMAFTTNIGSTPRLGVGILTDSNNVSSTKSKEIEQFKAYLSKFKIKYRLFSDSFAAPALSHLINPHCICLVVSKDPETERKVMASGRYVLRLSDKVSECPYIVNANYRNLTHTIMTAQTQLCRSGTAQAIARYAIGGGKI